MTRSRQREQALGQARFTLERWIGDERIDRIRYNRRSSRRRRPCPPYWNTLATHPELDVLQQRINESQANVDLAEAGRLPDWRVEFGYGYRRDYSDMVMLQVGMDLPLFAANRQNRDVASASAMGEAAAAQWDDGKRRLEARVFGRSRSRSCR